MSKRERASNSSVSSLERSPSSKNLKMASEEEAHVAETPSLASIFELIVKVQKNTEDIKKENSDFRRELLDLKKECATRDARITKLEQENKSLRSEVEKGAKRIDWLSSEVPTLVSKIHLQGEQLDELRQYQRKYNVEIHGIPEVDGEDLEELVEDIAKEMNVEVESSDVDIVHRQKSRIDPRPILVKFKCYGDKKLFYDARRKLKHFKGDDTKVNGARRIYINEHLTTERKRLFAQVRQKAKQYKWFRVTTNDGKIFVKTSKTARSDMVTKEADLEDLYA